MRKAEYRVALALPRRVAETALAEDLGVSVEALRAAFAHVYGVSIYRSLLKFRVRLVDQVLGANADLNPRVIAEICGFGYFGRFHQLYRRDTGRSPGPNVRCGASSPDGLAMARAALAATVDQYFSEMRA
uniref:Transcriptional regulator, AraC family n=1 Tax=Caulobacter sp. (strain K31) TaxID=366602 RepID=B0T7Q7_CAUSK